MNKQYKLSDKINIFERMINVCHSAISDAGWSRIGLMIPLETVHRPMIVDVQVETKAPQSSVARRVKAAEQRIQ